MVSVDEELQLLKTANSNLTWLQTNYDTITNEHDNQFIAISNAKFIDSDATLEGLITKLKSKGVDVRTTLIKYVTSIPTIL